jgi:hypothetical protein
MKGLAYEKRGKSGLEKLVLFLLFPFVILVFAFIVYKLFFVPDAVIEGMDAFNRLPREKTVTLNCANIKSIHISIIQNGRIADILKDVPESGDKQYKVLIKPKEFDLTDGTARVIVKARSGILKEVKHEIKSVIDTVPPSLDVLRATSIVYQGSAGVASLRAKDAVSVDVVLDDRKFRASKVTTGVEQEITPDQKRKSEEYLVFFPAPLDIKEGSRFYAVARDIAGNRNMKVLPTRLKPREYSSSDIEIDDDFINTVIAPLLNEMNIADPVRAFRTVNEDWREDDRGRLREIAQRTEPEVLWEGRFIQLRNSKVMATYGDKRTYSYNNEPVSKSVHLGYDLASVSHAPVGAANTGVVKFAGELGIYGNTVIIDHGLGLMSLYGHLSVISVSEGDAVSKGEIIAETGSTGLAGGDHLHFGILIHGVEVSPLYWWDSGWLRTSILQFMEY